MPYCPRCRFEYRAGVRRCPDCGAALVARLPAVPSFSPAPGPEAVALVEARAFLVTVTGEVHARLLQDALRGQGLVSRLEAGAAPPFAPWIPSAVTATEQLPFAIYVRPQDLVRARQIYADFESSAQPAAEEAERDQEEGPEPPPFDLKGYLRGLYGREIPRLLKDLRWYLLAVAVLDCAATALGYRAGAAASAYAPSPYSTAYLPALLFALVPDAGSAPGWLGISLHNALLGVCYYLWGAISLGAIPLYALWLDSYDGGCDMGLHAGLARAAWGGGAADTVAGALLPHALLETPASWLIAALALRAGLVWIRPLPGMRRWPSAAAVLRQFGMALLLVLPMLFVGAILETGANPWFYNRYIVGIGRAPGMVKEQEMGRAPFSWPPVWSPDGTSFATVSTNCHSVWTRRRGGESSLLARDESKEFTTPAWSPDSVHVAVLNASPGVARSELLIGRVFEEGLREVTGGPAGQYLQAAWHPTDGRIGVLVGGEETAGTRAPSLWVADPALNVWEQLAHLPDGAESEHGFSWSPDGRQIAFARLTAPESEETQLWAMDCDGGRPRRLTAGEHDAWPAWSPDGKWIAFLSLPPVLEEEEPDALEGGYPPLSHICLVRADGTDRRDNVAAAEGWSSLSWSADGRKLFYLRLGTMIAGTPKGL